jgi:hypothetical protein
LGSSEVSFTAKIHELQEGNASLSSELSRWKYQAGSELETRRKTEKTVQEVQTDNKKLEHYVQEWKLMAERSQGKIVRYYEGVDKIFAILAELKSDSAC